MTNGTPPVLSRTIGPGLPLLFRSLFSLSVCRISFLSHWKTSVIVPFSEKGSMHDPENFCHTTYTPVPFRLVEKHAREQSVNSPTTQNLTNPSQHGFLRRRSCQTCQLDVLELISQKAESHRLMLIFFLDMSSAFNRVSQSQILAKIKRNGVRNTLQS